uniref:Uncharacterized protein n=1 Tax=Tetradesmus obliquus TaxID=3088 RepID=A0A383WI79_TETOB|eukprot:jgi/Sobl393_1/1277/SZX77185.1
MAAAFGGAAAAAAGQLPAQAAASGTASSTAADTTAAAAATAPRQAANTQMQLAHLRVEGHTALGLALQQLPATGSLTSLFCRADFAGAEQQLPAVLRHTALRSVTLWGTVYTEHDRGSGEVHSQDDDDVLAPLTGLAQLTRLRLGSVRPAQLRCLPVQLRQLEVNLTDGELEEEEGLGPQQAVLQLGHLILEDNSYDDDQLLVHPIGVHDVLPPNLRHSEFQADCFSVAPFLALQQLPQLELCFDAQAPAAHQLRKLSSMKGLTELQLQYSNAGGYDAAAATAWAQLPLRNLRLLNYPALDADPSSSKRMVTPRAVVGRLSALTQLTCLVLGDVMLGGTASVHLLATVGQLAAALAPLTGLQELCIKGFVSVAADAGAAAGKPKSRSKAGKATGSAGGGVVAQHGADGVLALLQALAGLSRLHAVLVELPLAMTQQDAARAAAAAQGMGGWLAEARVWEGGLQVKL